MLFHGASTGVIEINNLTNFSVNKKFFTGVAKKVLKGENRERENISIAFVNPEEIQTLNKKYRKKDKPTDVLSFEKVSDFKDEVSEIIICPAVVRSNVADSHTTFKKEMSKILIHGVLHALGYDHERSKKDEIKMQEKQDFYLSKIK